MSNALRIDRYTSMTHMAVDEFAQKVAYALDKLEGCANDGGFITPGTTEAIQLHSDALVLRDMADRMMKRRAALLANEPQPFQKAAE